MCDAPTVYSSSSHRARKPHRCDECRRVIEPGETYEYVFGVWDGQSGSYHTCAECWEMRGEMQVLMREGGAYEEEIACDLSFGCLVEVVRDWDNEVSQAVGVTYEQ